VLSPLRGADGHWRTQRTTVPVGEPLDAYLPPQQGLAQVMVNGGSVPQEHWALYHPAAGDEVWCWPQWGDFITPTMLIAAGISLAVGLATATISHYLFRPKPLLLEPQNTMTQPEERTFSFEGIRTAVGPGGIIPVLYGRHRVGGQLLAAAVDPAYFVVNGGLALPTPIQLVWGGDSTLRIVVQCIGHGLQDGDSVVIQGVQGKTATNGFWTVDVLDADVLALEGTLGLDAREYTGGGTLVRYGRTPGMGNSTRAVAAPPTLSLLLALGEGPIDAILTDTIRINDQPITNFPGVQIFTRLGTPDQTPIAELGETKNSFADGRQIPDTVPSLQYTCTAPCTGFVLNIAFLEGLFYVTETGEKLDNTAYLQYRWSVSGTGAWSSWITVPVIADRTAPVRIGFRQDALPLAVYQLEIWAHGGGGDGSVVAAVTDELRAHWRSVLESVTEIVGGAQAYPNTALLGLKALASEQLQGGLPNVTVEVRGLTVRVGSFLPTRIWSDNPAWCILDFLTHPRYGIGLPDSEMDLAAWSTYAAECDSLIDGEARHRLNIVLDQEERLQPLLLRLLGGSRGLLLKSGGLWTPRPTRSETPVALLNWAMCTNVVLTYTRDIDDINVLEARFANEDQRFEQDVLSWPPIDQRPAVEHKHSFDLRGVTTPSRVMRALQYERNRRRFENVILEMDCASDAMILQVHDLFRFAHPLPGWSVSGRLQEGSTTTSLVLDLPVSLTGDVDYLAYVRHEDGTVEGRPVLPVVLGEVTTVTLAVPLSQVPTARTSLWSFGQASVDAAMRTFRVTSLQRKSDTTVHLEAIVHNPSIYDDPVGVPLPIITDLPNPEGPPPPLTALVLTEVNRIQASGASLRVVNLSWDVAPLAAGYALYGGAMILRRTVAASGAAGQGDAGTQDFAALQDPLDANTSFVPIIQVRGHVLDYDDFTVVAGATYVYRVVPISVRGVPNNVGAREGVIHVAGPTTPGYFPGTPQNLRLKGQPIGVVTYEGHDISWEWDPVPASPLFTSTFFVQDYLVQIWAPGQEYLMLHTVVPLGPPGASVTWTYTYAQNTEDNVRAGMRGPRRDVAIFVWARTNTGRISLEPATMTVRNPAPDMSDIEPDTTPLFEAGIVEWTQWVEPRDLDHYVVILDTVTPPAQVYQQLPRGVQKILLPGLTALTPYYVQIVPWDTFGPGIGTAIATFTPVPMDADKLDEIPPATPTGLFLTTGVTVQPEGTIQPWVEAHWAGNTESDLAGYELQFRIPPSVIPTVVTPGALDTSYRHDAIPGGVTLAAKILAFDKFRNRSAFTDEVTIITGGDSVAPAAPTNLYAVGSIRSVALLWTPPADPDYAYSEVWWALSNQRALAQFQGTGTYDYIHEGLNANDTRYYWVRAVDTSGNASTFHPASATEGVVGTAGQLDDTYISSLVASKILAGVLTVLVKIGIAERIDLDGVNGNIVIWDQQSPVPAVRVIMGHLGALTTDYGLRIFTPTGATMFDITDGGVHADGIKAGSIVAGHLRTDTAVITVAAQIANAIIGDAHITGLTASKITTGTLSAVLPIGANSVYIDGPNQQITVWDQQFPQQYRVLLGKLGTGLQDYGLYIWDAAGNVLLSAAGITANGIPTGTIQANHLRTDQAVITGTAQIANAIIGDAHITSLTASKITSGTIQSQVLWLGGAAGTFYLDGHQQHLVILDALGHLRVLLGHLAPIVEDYGLYIWNAAGTLMWDLSSGATTAGITPNAVTESIQATQFAGTILVNDAQALIAVVFPTLTAGDQILIIGEARVDTTTAVNCALTLTLNGSALLWAQNTTFQGIMPLTIHYVYTVPATTGTTTFTLGGDSAGTTTFDHINLSALRRKR
jgi:hypothetical protein